MAIYGYPRIYADVNDPFLLWSPGTSPNGLVLLPGTGISFLYSNGSVIVQNTSGGGGSVTSIGFSAPNIFNVAGSPITTSGTINLSLVNQAVNTVFAGPSAGPANTPDFRILTGNDLYTTIIPGSGISIYNSGDTLTITAQTTGSGGGTVTNVSAGNLPPLFTTTVSNPTVNPGISFTLTAQPSGTFYAGPSTGANSSPTFRVIQEQDLEVLVAGTNITLTPAGSNLTISATGSSNTNGTVTSVSIGNLTPLFTTNVSNPTTTPSAVYTLTTQPSGTAFMGPVSGVNAAPTFRPIEGQDINPVLIAGSNITLTPSGSNLTITASGSSNTNGTVTSVSQTVPSSLLNISGSPITTSGTLGITLANQSSGLVFCGPVSGASTTPTFRNLQGSDVQTAIAAGTNISLALINNELTISNTASSASQQVNQGISGGRLTGINTAVVGASSLFVDTSSSGVSTIYYAPYLSNVTTYYNGASWVQTTFPILSYSISGLASGGWDFYHVWNGSSLILGASAWVNNTTPNNRIYQDGVACIGNSQQRFLGSIFVDASNKTYDWSGARLICNYQNQVARSLFATDYTSSWTTTSTVPIPANGNTTNGTGAFQIFQCIVREPIAVRNLITGSNSIGSQAVYGGFYINGNVNNSSQSYYLSFAAHAAGTSFNSISQTFLGLSTFQRLQFVSGGTGTYFSSGSECIMEGTCFT